MVIIPLEEIPTRVYCFKPDFQTQVPTDFIAAEKLIRQLWHKVLRMFV